MNIGNYIMAPSVRQVVPPPPPQQGQMALNAGLLAAQNPAAQTRSFTAGAVQASDVSDQSRSSQKRKGSEESSAPKSLSAPTKGGGGVSHRGRALDVKV
ncbi:MAG: hypothetical protein WCK65_10825 [Rhodospirillaceae bacterium]